MCAGMDIDQTACHPDLQLPTQSEVIAASAYAKRCFHRILCAWVQDLLERRRTSEAQVEISYKKVA
jgi:hypothetical protein